MSRILFFTEKVVFALSHPQKVIAWLSNTIKEENHTLVHLNIIFCSDRYLQEKNYVYLQHDTFTDVITFDYTTLSGKVEGDLYISVERVRENAKMLKHSFEQELYTIIVHGVLHLVGYNDHTSAEKCIMRDKEYTYVARMMAT